MLLLAAMLAPLPAAAQELPEGQDESDFRASLDAAAGFRGAILSFEAWQQAAGVAGVLPTWQITRTASRWRDCGGPRFEIPPVQQWPGMAKTLRFIRDSVRPALGPVEAVSGYRNPVLNQCAGGAPGSAHKSFFALDLIPLVSLSRGEIMRRLCLVHARDGEAANVGLGFYAFARFHVDTSGFRRWGAAGPAGNESPCAVIERGEDPEAPPLPIPLPPGEVDSAPAERGEGAPATK